MDIFTQDRFSTFFHSTKIEDVAKSICDFGFFGKDYLRNTCDYITPDTFKYWYNYRKDYGDFIIVIQIPSDVLYNETHLLKPIKEIENKINEDVDDEDKLSFDFMIDPKYVRGYYIRDDNTFIKNKKWILNQSKDTKSPPSGNG